MTIRLLHAARKTAAPPLTSLTVTLSALTTALVLVTISAMSLTRPAWYHIIPIATIVSVGFLQLLSQSAKERVPWNPLLIFLATWSTLFVVRPAFMLVHSDFGLRGKFHTQDQFGPVLLAAAVAGAAYLFGDWLGRLQRFAPGRQLAPPISHRNITPRRWSIGLLLIGSFASVTSFASGLTGGSAYTYYAPLLTVPGVLLAVADWRYISGFHRVATWAASAVYTASYSIGGHRAFILVLLTGAIVVNYIRSDKRPQARHIVPISLLVFFVIIVGFQSWRDYSRGATDDLSFSVGDSLTQVFLGGTTEMLPGLGAIFQTEGSSWTQQPGRTIWTTAVHWIPSSIWPDKPTTYDETLYRLWFPQHYAASKANIQYSLIGDWYTDSGWPGIVIGFIAVAFLMRVVFNKVRSTSPVGVIAAFGPVPIIMLTMLRGNIALNLGLALFLIAPALMAHAAARLHAA